MADILAKMRQRYDTAANWAAANPTLLPGEVGVESDTFFFKIGDGSTPWNSLSYITVAGIPFASVTDVRAGSPAERVVDVVAGKEYLVRNPSFAGAQGVAGDVTLSGRATVTQAPRAGAEGNADIANKLAVQNEVAAAISAADTSGGPADAQKAPKLQSDGTLSITFLPSMFSNLDYRGGFDPTDVNGDGGNGALPLENVAGGGLTPSAVDGSYVQVTEAGFWDLSTGTTDPGPAGGSVVEAQPSDLFVFATANNAWARVLGSDLVGTGFLKIDGTNTMDGNLAFSAGTRQLKFQGDGAVEGQSQANLADLRYFEIDCGTY